MRLKNTEKCRFYNKSYYRAYYKKNRIRLQEQHKRYYKRNRPRLLEYLRRYREKNSVILLEKQRRYRKKNKAVVARRALRYYKRNETRIKKVRCRYYKRNRTRLLNKYRVHSQHIKIQVIESYGGACRCCGESNIGFLTIDHMQNDGAQHRRRAKIKGGSAYYRWLIKHKFPSGFQVLCYNCNCGRAHTPDRVCPHKRE